MATQEDVEIFLKQFRVKMEIFGIIFRNDRGKNIQTLLDLNITELERLQVVKTIEIEDYSEGPIADTLHNGMDMWVVGRTGAILRPRPERVKKPTWGVEHKSLSYNELAVFRVSKTSTLKTANYLIANDLRTTPRAPCRGQSTPELAGACEKFNVPPPEGCRDA